MTLRPRAHLSAKPLWTYSTPAGLMAKGTLPHSAAVDRRAPSQTTQCFVLDLLPVHRLPPQAGCLLGVRRPASPSWEIRNGEFPSQRSSAVPATHSEHRAGPVPSTSPFPAAALSGFMAGPSASICTSAWGDFSHAPVPAPGWLPAPRRTVTTPSGQTRGSRLSHALEPGAKPGYFPPMWEKGIPALSHGDCPEPTAGTQWAQKPVRGSYNPQQLPAPAHWHCPGHSLPGALPARCTSLKRTVWGPEVCAYMPATAADGIAACTAAALALHGSLARGWLLLPKDPRLR